MVASVVALILAALAPYPLNAALMRLASSYGAHVTLQLPDALSLLLASVLVAILAALSARSEEHTSELQSLMRISYAVFCLKKKKKKKNKSIAQYIKSTRKQLKIKE